jgi:uncharacterized protein
MSEVNAAPPEGTPTWIDLEIPDLDRAREFYGALFGWQFSVGPEETGHYTMCELRGRPVAGLMPNQDQDATRFQWTMYVATADCDRSVQRVVDAGGTVITPTMDVMQRGRMAIAEDTVGARFGMWQAGAFHGAEIVNEPNAWVRNDLVTNDPGPAREFYSKVFDYSLRDNPDMPGMDFTFLIRPDGYEIGGIVGAADATTSVWGTMFEVDDTDKAVERATAVGGTVITVRDTPYGRHATMTDPFGVEFSIGARP